MNECDSARGKQREGAWTSRVGVLAAALALSVSALGACAPANEGELRAEADEAASAARYAGIHQRSIALGALEAPVTLFELSDLRCHFCRDFTRGALPAIVERHVRPGHVRLVFHNLPILGEPSRRAARMALAISLQDRMWEFVDAFAAVDGAGAASPDLLHRVAASVPGVDVDKAERDMNDGAVGDRLAQAEGVAREFHVRGTPTFLIARTGEELHVLRAQHPGDATEFLAAIEALLAPP